MKPFKTISLVDRLEASAYNDLSARPSVEPAQGAVDLKQNIAPRKVTEVEIKALPDTRRRNEELIKAMQKARPKGSLPSIPTFQTAPLTSFVLPKAQIKFSKTMQLEDRLEQSAKVQNTSHLPHFFLSDAYTDYITIKPLGIFNHTSVVDVPKFNFVGNKGGTETNTWQFNAIARQGAASVNGTYISNVVVSNPPTSVLISQGTFFTNGAFVSQTNITPVVGEGTILSGQGAVYSNGGYTSIVDVKKPQPTQQQGGIIPAKAISPLVVRLLQGLTIDNAGNLRSFVTPAKPALLQKPEETAPILQNPGFSALVFDQGTVTLVNTSFSTLDVDQGTIALKTSEYLANRAKSILLPRVEHGSAILQITDFQNKSFFGQTLIKAQGEDWFATNRPAVGESEVTKLLTNQLTDPAAKDLLRGAIRGWKYERTGERQGTAPEGNVRVVAQSIPSAWNDTSGAIKPGKVERRSLGITPDGEGSDFITLQIDKVSGGSIKFKALLTSLSDNWSPSWTDQNYVGRQDTLKVFKGTTRSVSLGFKVVAWSNATAMFQKLETLAKITSVGSPTGPGYVKGPLIKLTVGKLFSKVYCACNSLKVDFNPAEFSWDINKQLPMLADVSMDVSILTSNNAQMLNADTNKYYNH